MYQKLIPALCVMLGVSLFVTGCGTMSVGGVVTYSDIKPEYPPAYVADPVFSSSVDSLTPTLKWKPKDGVSEYDVAVWKCPAPGQSGIVMEDLGERVFFSKGIKETCVAVTPPLEPDTIYLWSVRASGSKQWSTYSQREWDLLSHSKGLHFKFHTPKPGKNTEK